MALRTLRLPDAQRPVGTIRAESFASPPAIAGVVVQEEASLGLLGIRIAIEAAKAAVQASMKKPVR